MLDVVFNEGAKGLLEMAKKGWGDGGLVAAFDLLLDYGDISERFPSKERIKSLQMLHLDTETIQRRVAAAVQGLQTIRSEKAVRVWLAPDRPGDLCGLCWLMEAIDGLPVAVQVVPLPRWVEQGKVLVHYAGWFEVEPERWKHFLPMARMVGAIKMQHYISVWRKLAHENMDLRVLINGTLHSFPPDFYDPWIRMELNRQKRIFPMAKLVGDILTRHDLGITDRFIAWRIEMWDLKEAGTDDKGRRLLQK